VLVAMMRDQPQCRRLVYGNSEWVNMRGFLSTFQSSRARRSTTGKTDAGKETDAQGGGATLCASRRGSEAMLIAPVLPLAHLRGAEHRTTVPLAARMTW
jgi:hypothetical protein